MPQLKAKKIYVIAGEPSGDLIGGKLIDNLRNMRSNLEFRGVGGDKMINSGLTSIFPMKDISVMGYFEILPSLPRIMRRIKQTVSDVVKQKPDLIITIDSPGFNFRVVKKIRDKLGDKIKIIHYVAPSVWAYKPQRVRKVASLYDHLLMILPIEKPYFEKHIPCTYVGHPIIEDNLKSKIGKESLRKKFNILEGEKLITLMPGSRAGEIKRHLSIFKEAIDGLKNRDKIKCFIPTIKNLEDVVKNYVDDRFVVSSDLKIKSEYISASDLALIKSGTSSIEMLSYKVPTIVAYKMSKITYFYIKKKVTVRYASLCNIISEKLIIPEFIQDDCTPGNLSKAMDLYLSDEKICNEQINDFEKVAILLGGNGKEKPSQKAAKVILEYLD